MRYFTDAELAEITAEGLIYEPEDSIIVDPVFSSVLNDRREIQVADSIYRYINDGVLVYEANQEIDEAKIDKICSKIEGNNLQHREVQMFDDVKFIKIEYANPVTKGGSDDLRPYHPTDPPQPDPEITYNDDKSITLTNNVKIEDKDIRRVTYRKGNGDANWLQKTVSGIFGTNVVAENNFDKTHRMKLRTFAQDYILCSSVGMTVRMQQRKLGIWWRKKADEFRYGWSCIECKYSFDTPAFTNTLPTINGEKPVTKYPTILIKKFPYRNEKIVLFHVPLIEYDVESGDINKVVAAGMKAISSTIIDWLKENVSKQNNPRGLYTTDQEDRVVYVTYPQGEDVAYNEGREAVRWSLDWFSGNFEISCLYNLSGSGGNKFKSGIKSFEPNTKIDINRAKMYGAVKYDGKWKACVIATE